MVCLDCSIDSFIAIVGNYENKKWENLVYSAFEEWGNHTQKLAAQFGQLDFRIIDRRSEYPEHDTIIQRSCSFCFQAGTYPNTEKDSSKNTD